MFCNFLLGSGPPMSRSLIHEPWVDVYGLIIELRRFSKTFMMIIRMAMVLSITHSLVCGEKHRVSGNE